MKKTLLTLLTLLAINTVFAQEQVSFDICGAKSKKEVTKIGFRDIMTIPLEKLMACSEIKTGSNTFKISSFTIAMTSPSGEEYIEHKVEGNKNQ